MTTLTFRRYAATDYKLVNDFLIEHYQPGNQDGNWLQPAWEYMHNHPNLDESSLDKIGIWEDAGLLVSVAHYESSLGEAFFQVHPEYDHLKPVMLFYARNRLCAETESGERVLRVYIHDYDQVFEKLARSLDYKLDKSVSRAVSELALPTTSTAIELPDGFRIKSLAEDNDLSKIHSLLWRGFGHPGEPPDEGLEGRKKIQSAPNFRKELTIVVEGPSGDFVSYCGMWYEPQNKIAYVEPVATDPDFRRMGLGQAAVQEGLRRCGELGATVAYVGSDQDFYQEMGFTKKYTSRSWVMRF